MVKPITRQAKSSPVDYRKLLITNHAQHYTQAISQVFQTFSIAGAVAEVRVAPRYITVGVVIQSDLQLRKAINLTPEICHRAGLGVGSLEPPITAVLVGGQVAYQFSLPEFIQVRNRQVRLWTDLYLSDLEQTSNREQLVVGMGMYHTPTHFGLTTATPHTLVCGTSGSGKTELLTTITYQLLSSHTPDELRLTVIDPKGDLAERFRDKAHLLWQPAGDQQDIANLLAHIHQEYLRRRQSNLRHEYKLVLLMDEADDERILKDKDNYQKVLDFVQRGRSLNIHLIVGTHRPDQESLGNIGQELTNKYLGKVANANASGQLQAGLQLHKLAGRGDFFHVVGENYLRFQVALTTAADLDWLPLAAVPLVPIHQPAQAAISLPIGEHRPAHRPTLQVSGSILAHYVKLGPENVQFHQAEQWGLSRRGHELHRKEAIDFLTVYRSVH